MDKFIIITNELSINLFSIIFINKQIKMLHDKHCRVGIFHNRTHMVLVRELDDTMFLNSDYDVINYTETNKKAMQHILDNFPIYLNYPIPRVDSYIK